MGCNLLNTIKMQETSPKELKWRVNTPQLLKEIQNNHGTSILRKPLAILGGILAEVAERAIELNDPKLNALMCRLALYEESDPYSPEYNPDLVNETINKG